MNFITETNRIYAKNESGNITAEITFPEAGTDTVSIDHTFVDSSLRGQGVAAELIETAYDKIKGDGKKAYAVCSYAVKWFDEHPEKQDILADK